MTSAQGFLINMVLSAQDTAASASLRVGPTPTPPSDVTSFPISKPYNNPTTAGAEADVLTVATASRPWNLRSRNGSVAIHQKERQRFSLALTCDEIAEDIYAVTGTLPRRKPMKRPRVVQKQIEMVFPGSWLKEITQELYKVPH